MWTFLQNLFGAIGGFFRFLSETKLREAGRNEEILKSTLEALDATNTASEIDRRTRPSNPADILRDL